MTWTRARPAENQTSYRVHIAHDRVAQPARFGGLSVPDPQIQIKSIRFIWIKKFLNAERTLTWYKILDSWLISIGCPTIQEHLKVGSREWNRTSLRMLDLSQYWAHVFASVAEFMVLANKQYKQWHLIPIIGNEHSPETHLNLGSLRWANLRARDMIEAGLINVGQLFCTNEYGHIDHRRMKSHIQLQEEFNIQIPMTMMNSIIMLVNSTRNNYRSVLSSETVLPERITTIQALLRKYKTGCSAANQMLLRQQRETWQWGPVPRSHMTYLRDGITNISAEVMSRAFEIVRAKNQTPSIQWTSTQILLRTIWTRVKEANTRRRTENTEPYNDTCSNCGTAPERTVHLFYDCPLAKDMWRMIFAVTNTIFSRGAVITQIDGSLDQVFFHSLPDNLPKSIEIDINDIIMIMKHILYRLRFRERFDTYPTLRTTAIILVIEIEKLIEIRRRKGNSHNTLSNIINELKRRIEFN